MTAANRHRLALLTWIVVYPMITGLLMATEGLLSELPTPLRTLALSAVMVPAMVFFAMPFMTARLSKWLNAGQN